MGSNNEGTPLLSGSDAGSSYYFLNNPETQGGTTPSVRDTDGGAVQETIPEGSSADEFAPRPVGMKGPNVRRENSILGNPNAAAIGGDDGRSGVLSKLLGLGKPKMAEKVAEIKQRKAPIKVEPKVFFANERTFLAWMHISVILAGASIAILAFADSDDNPTSQLYGIALLPVAIAFIVYSMYQYSRRAYMIRNKMPGPYDDTTGPTVLGIVLMISIVCQFAIKLYAMSS